MRQEDLPGTLKYTPAFPCHLPTENPHPHYKRHSTRRIYNYPPLQSNLILPCVPLSILVYTRALRTGGKSLDFTETRPHFGELFPPVPEKWGNGARIGPGLPHPLQGDPLAVETGHYTKRTRTPPIALPFSRRPPSRNPQLPPKPSWQRPARGSPRATIQIPPPRFSAAQTRLNSCAPDRR
jgi:hypothetical protein